jgi:hypothetical protein
MKGIKRPVWYVPTETSWKEVHQKCIVGPSPIRQQQPGIVGKTVMTISPLVRGEFVNNIRDSLYSYFREMQSK